MGNSRGNYMREYRQRNREEKLRSEGAEPKKIVPNSTQRSRDFRAHAANSRFSSIPSASTSTAIPNVIVDHATLKLLSLTCSSTSLAELPKDMDNYMEYHVMGSVSQVRMKPGCIPTKFDCQPDRKTRTSKTIKRPNILKKRKIMVIEDCERDIEERSMLSKHSQPEHITIKSSESLKLSTETSSETKLVCVDGLPYDDYNSDDEVSNKYLAASRWSPSFNREDESISMVPQQTSNVNNTENRPSNVEFNRTKIVMSDIPTDAIQYSLPVKTKPSSIVLNDLDSCETYLISKLRSYNPTIRSKVLKLFNEIIFNADTGVLNKNDSVPTSSPNHNISPEYVEIIPQDTSDKYFIKEEPDSEFVEGDESSDFQDSTELVSTKTLDHSFEQHSKQYYQQRNNMKGSKKQVSNLTTHEPPLQTCIPSSEFSLSIKEEICIEEHEMENTNEEDN